MFPAAIRLQRVGLWDSGKKIEARPRGAKKRASAVRHWRLATAMFAISAL